MGQSMSSIEQFEYYLWDDLSNKHKIPFSSGLNLISGANGTGKTKLLQQIVRTNTPQGNQVRQGARFTLSCSTNQKFTVSAFSPQRSAQKQAVEQAVQQFRSDPNVKQSTLNSILNHAIHDNGFQQLKSISEYFVYAAEDFVVSDGDTTKNQAAERALQFFRQGVQKVLNYDVEFKYDADKKNYRLNFEKSGNPLAPSELSHGENAVLVLVCALIYSKDDTDVFLIDEPELHLNWSLEAKLFEFFDWFCNEYTKQIIAVTHSRAVFLEQFSDASIFFDFDELGNFSIKKQPSKMLIEQLSGDITKIFEGVTVSSRLVYVEDATTKAVVEALADVVGSSLEVQPCNGRAKVLQISKAMRSTKISNVYFLVDRDNLPLTPTQRHEFHENTIQLEKYCLENSFLSLELLGRHLGNTQSIEKKITQFILASKEPAFAVAQKALQNGVAWTEIIDNLDGSKIAKGLFGNDEKQKISVLKEIASSLSVEEVSTFFPELSALLGK